MNKADYLAIKKLLFEKCLLFADEKLQNISERMASNKKALLSETKSSAGDKHETGRAMIQLEMEKAGQQLVVVEAMKKTLEKISFEKNTQKASLGSLIKTSKGMYYLSISIGKMAIENSDYFVISSQSPIGEQLLGKIVGDSIPFNKATILEIY